MVTPVPFRKDVEFVIDNVAVPALMIVKIRLRGVLGEMLPRLIVEPFATSPGGNRPAFRTFRTPLQKLGQARDHGPAVNEPFRAPDFRGRAENRLDLQVCETSPGFLGGLSGEPQQGQSETRAPAAEACVDRASFEGPQHRNTSGFEGIFVTERLVRGDRNDDETRETIAEGAVIFRARAERCRVRQCQRGGLPERRGQTTRRLESRCGRPGKECKVATEETVGQGEVRK